jgi:hypothetical protein
LVFVKKKAVANLALVGLIGRNGLSMVMAFRLGLPAYRNEEKF